MTSITAKAHPNIALIKYWGDVDRILHIPANGSISMNLDSLFTRTTVAFDEGLHHDRFTLDDRQITGLNLDRVSTFLSRVRQLAGIEVFAHVESRNNFPAAAGIASSASGFAALALAASRAAGLDLDEKALSRLARTGSGSACRSIPSGFVEWQAGSSDEDSFAFSIASPAYWDLVDCITLVSQDEKSTSSQEGHSLAGTSILQASRVSDSPRRLSLCRDAILGRDFEKLASIVELDSNLMHAVMITSNPPLLYWQPGTVNVIQAVVSMRKTGLPVCYTIDAGPNVHVLSLESVASVVASRLGQIPGVQSVILARPGGGALLEKGQ